MPTIEKIKILRDKTGAGMMTAKKKLRRRRWQSCRLFKWKRLIKSC